MKNLGLRYLLSIIVLGSLLLSIPCLGNEITIGTGTSSWSLPLYTSSHDARTQTIYLASEIGGPFNIAELALDVAQTPGQTMKHFTIRMKHITLSTYSSAYWETSGWTTVYQAIVSVSSVGWKTFIFSTPFNYNGSDNLMIDISFDNITYSSSGYCRYSTPGGVRSVYSSANSNYGDPLTWSGNSPTPYSTSYVPNIKLRNYIPVTGLTLNKSTISLYKDVSETLVATLSPSDATNKAITWSSSDNNVATVDNNGIVTAVDAGDCVITATSVDGGFAPTCNVNVKSIPEGTMGEYTTTGWAYDSAIKGNYACLADGAGFVIFNISNPSNPIKVGEIATAGDMCSVDVSGDYAYLASWGSGLEIIDISDPANPVKVGGYTTTGKACGVAVSGDFAYIADTKVGLEIFNISNPANPIRVGGYNNNGFAYSVAVSGSYAYVTDYSTGLVIIDISNPVNPQKVSEYTTFGVASGIAVVGNYMYIADSESGLIIFDVTNPASPIKIGEFDYNGYAYDITIVGKYAYIADFDEGLVIFDISNPASSQMIAKYNTTGNGNGVSPVGNYIYIAEGDAGVGVLGVGYQVTGHVSLGTYYGDLANVDMRFGLMEDGSQLWNTPIDLDALGNFTVPYVLPGNYDLSIKGSHWLRRIVSGVNVDANTAIANLTLINGDVVDNNEVDFSDINAVRAAYGSFPGDGNWNEMADVDGSGEVDFSDINMVRGNYGEIGE